MGQGLLKGREAESPLWSRSEHEHRLRIKGNSGNPQEPPAGSMLAFLNIQTYLPAGNYPGRKLAGNYPGSHIVSFLYL